MDRIIPISDLQSKAKRYVEQVKKTEEPLIITQRGRAAAVLLSYEDYEGIMAARDEMSFSDWRERLVRADREIGREKGVPLETYLKKRGRVS